MTALATLNPIPQYFDLDGTPLNAGKLYFGVVNQNPETSPVTVYWDAAATQPASQPIATMNGYPVRSGSPAIVYALTDYSLTVRDNKLRQVLYTRNSADFGNAATIIGVVNALRADFANSTDAAKGAGLGGFDWTLLYASLTAGWGIRTAQGLQNALRYMPVAEWAGILAGTSTTDLTTYIQQAVDAGPAYFPRGKWPVSATTGIMLGNGAVVQGAGRGNTVFWAILGTGGSLAEKAAYGAGSVFRRSFTPGVANARIGNWRLADFAVILNHPTAAVTTTAEQLAIDLRNVSRWSVERVHVGNYVPNGCYVAKTDPPSGFAQQGYGFVTGAVPTSDPGYCGGEVGVIRECSAWGAYKTITLDDGTLIPSSAAHAVQVLQCDIQLAHHLLVQESQYTTGVTWGDNTLQGAAKRNGDASSSYVERFSGYNSKRYGGYTEGSSPDYLLLLDSASKGNCFELGYYTTLNAAAITDLGNGNRNIIRYRKDTGTIPGGLDGLGAPVELYDSELTDMQWRGNWTGAVIAADFADGITVTRNGVGDYNLTLAPVQKNAVWDVSIVGDANASSHPFTLCLVAGTQSTSTIRFFTFGQNAGTTTQLDPRKMWIKVNPART